MRVLFNLLPGMVNIITGLFMFISAKRMADSGASSFMVGATMAVWAFFYASSAFILGRILTKRNAVKVLLAGQDNGINFLFDDEGTTIKYTLPFDPLSYPDQMKDLKDSDSGVQFSHTIEEQLGGQLKAGLVLTDIYEDTNGEGVLHEHNVPTFIASRAVKP